MARKHRDDAVTLSEPEGETPVEHYNGDDGPRRAFRLRITST